MRTRLVAATVLAAALLAPAAATADTCHPPGYSGHDPRVRRVVVAGHHVAVVLPSGYDAAPRRRYPVVYLLSAALSSGEHTWLVALDALKASAGRPVILAIPDAGLLPTYSDWRNGAHRWETLHIRKVIPYVDSHFRTLADRAHRAVAGASVGGFGAFHYAARHPDLFAVAGGFSPLADITDRSPGSELAEEAFLAAIFNACPEAAGADDPNGVFGDPATDAVWWHNANPTDLAPNLHGTSVWFSSGTGASCDPSDLTYDGTPDPRVFVEPLIYDMSRNFDAAMTAASVRHTSEYHCGTHHPTYWQQELTAWLGVAMKAFGRRAPRAFDYRTVDPEFSVWGWSFAADPGRAPEFLDVRHASAAGVTLTGSGTERVTTAALFRPRQRVRISGGGRPARVTRASSKGRITFTVDLGPAHTLQQYTPAERAAEVDRGYFRSRRVRFTQ